MVVGYFRIFDELAMVRLSPSLIGNPSAATAMARRSVCSNVIVPQRSRRRYQASTTPGVDAASSPSLRGSSPSLCSSYHSMVASSGAIPSALIEKTCFASAS